MKSAIAFNLYRQRPELLALHEASLLVADPEVLYRINLVRPIKSWSACISTAATSAPL